MNQASATGDRKAGLRVWGWCTAVVVAEVLLYLSYRGHDARFHWFAHFFAGTSAALLVMAAVTARTRRPVPYPLLWPLAAHIFATAPDILFAGGVAHSPWMDVFLGHISAHYLPGRNLAWYAVFLVAVAAYLVAVDSAREPRKPLA